MLRHKNVRRIDLAENPYWASYIKLDVPNNPISKAIFAAEQYYKNILAYKGPIEVWNYGSWDEWTVRNKNIKNLYTREGETSAVVLHDVEQGKLFSDRTATLGVWRDFCDEFQVTDKQQRMICTANEELKKLYLERGLQLKTLDDLN